MASVQDRRARVATTVIFAIAAAGFTAFTLALGRLVGDRLVDRFGRTRVVQASGAIAVGGSAGRRRRGHHRRLPRLVHRPTLIGALAELSGRSLALWLLVGVGAVMALLAQRALQPRRAPLSGTRT